MASLRDTVKDYQDELRDGIAWVAFWKQGRSWNAEYFHLDMDDTLYPEDRSRLEEIKSIDPAAVILNGYYCGHLGEDMSLDELTAGVRYHYENSMNDIDGFIGAHDDRLPPEVIEEARAAAHEAGLPFSEKPYRDGEDFNPYVFDGSMSIEDYELMHRMMNEERSEQMAEPILSGYLSNLGKYTEGRPAGEWVTFPTTAEHLKEVFDRIGIDFKHYAIADCTDRSRRQTQTCSHTERAERRRKTHRRALCHLQALVRGQRLRTHIRRAVHRAFSGIRKGAARLKRTAYPTSNRACKGERSNLERRTVHGNCPQECAL